MQSSQYTSRELISPLVMSICIAKPKKAHSKEKQTSSQALESFVKMSVHDMR